MTVSITVVGSNIGYIDMMINEAQCGYSVDPSDIHEIVSVIKKLLSSDNDRKNMGKNGMNYIKKAFNWDSEEKKLLSLYSKLILSI